jgi:hypothetical protein
VHGSGEKSHQRQRVCLPLGVGRQQSGLGMGSGYVSLDGDVLDQHRTIGQPQRGHLAPRVDPQVRLDAMLARVLVNEAGLVAGAGLFEREAAAEAPLDECGDVGWLVGWSGTVGTGRG